MVRYKLHIKCLIIEVQGVFCQHPHLVTVHSRGTTRGRGGGAAGRETPSP